MSSSSYTPASSSNSSSSARAEVPQSQQQNIVFSSYPTSCFWSQQQAGVTRPNSTVWEEVNNRQPGSTDHTARWFHWLTWRESCPWLLTAGRMTGYRQMNGERRMK
jgi:hypothetical protein